MKAVTKVDIVDGKCVVTYSDGSEQELYEYPSGEGVTSGVSSVNGMTGDVVIPNATTSVNGLMSKTDKSNLEVVCKNVTNLKSDIDNIDNELLLRSSSNLVNLDDAVVGKLLNTGEVDGTATTYGTTGFIPVSDYVGKTLYIGRRTDSDNGVGVRTVPYLCTYDANKELIAYNSSWLNSIQISAGVAYVRYSLGISNTNYFSKTEPSRTGAWIDALPAKWSDYYHYYELTDSFKNGFMPSESPIMEIGGISSGNPVSSTSYVRTKEFIRASYGDTITLSPTEFGVQYAAIYIYKAPYTGDYDTSVSIPSISANETYTYTFTNDCYFKIRAAKTNAPTLSESDIVKFESITKYIHHYSHNDFVTKQNVFALPLDYTSIKTAMSGKINFAVQTDTHISLFDAYNENGTKSAKSDIETFKRVISSIESLNCNGFFNLGDIVRGYEFDPDYETRASIDEIIRDYLNLSCKKSFVIGNHDDGSIFYNYSTYPYNDNKNIRNVLFPQEQLNRITKYGSINNGLKNYNYVDIDGIRVITLYQRDVDYSSAVPTIESFTIGSDQITWLTNIALNTDLPVLVLTHAPLVSDLYATGGTGFSDTVTALHTFISGGGKVIAVLSGHTHEQADAKVDGINYIGFDNGYTFFELLSIDLANSTITCTPINSALETRTFTY